MKKKNIGRIPTAKGSIRHKSKKDYNRKKDFSRVVNLGLKDCMCDGWVECVHDIARKKK